MTKECFQIVNLKIISRTLQWIQKTNLSGVWVKIKLYTKKITKWKLNLYKCYLVEFFHRVFSPHLFIHTYIHTRKVIEWNKLEKMDFFRLNGYNWQMSYFISPHFIRRSYMLVSGMSDPMTVSPRGRRFESCLKMHIFPTSFLKYPSW